MGQLALDDSSAIGDILAEYSRLGDGRVILRNHDNAGSLVDWVKRPSESGFVLLPKRWIVERTFSWLGRHRRLSKDHVSLPESRKI